MCVCVCDSILAALQDLQTSFNGHPVFQRTLLQSRLCGGKVVLCECEVWKPLCWKLWLLVVALHKSEMPSLIIVPS